MQVGEEPIGRLGELAAIPTAFRVERVFDVAAVDGGLGGLSLVERRVAEPWLKDYDARNDPTGWPGRFDVSGWALLTARAAGERIGAAVVATGAGLDMLRGRVNAAALWDLRVAPVWRGRGAGTALFQAAEALAAGRGCRTLLIETQNVNVAACRLYRRMGCVLASIDLLAYPDLPGEVQLVWWKSIG